jgi:predicted AAA+ superfamily ATPase
MEYNKGHLLNFYEDIERLRSEREYHIKEVTEIEKEIGLNTLQYRIDSVSRILDYIHSNEEQVANDLKRFDTLITHCCNKLSGNIDGIELDLDNKEKCVNKENSNVENS